ncbi:UvrD-helicase domain-containing protein [Rouxiella badensis]|uniref:UvrD-helicase domain-containing protein n=1 Tax=Rouxiella badensis TaxID=1646377 RepID=UPI00178814CE|nr:ATP-dependent helicase [Rouxiella badensis]QOI56219.1 ATP-dependent helicase [Rouxiella badensis subsp. acadiensis]
MTLNFTPEQQEAIYHSGNMVITACPGSGKTTVVVEKIRRSLPELKNYQGVIAMTFTVKASEELKSRCRRNALDIKQSFFGTIDSFCLKEVIFPFISRVWGVIGSDIEVIYNDGLTEDDREKYNSLISKSLLTDDLHGETLSLLRDLYNKGFILMSSVGLIANYVLEQSISCKKYLSVKYKNVYVDEYQDSSEPQHKLFLKLVELGIVGVSVGDEEQSIYEFRGGDSKGMDELKNNIPGFKCFDMSLNHRCHPSISNYARRLFKEDCDLVDEEDIRVYQYTIEGTQTNIAKKISSWIESIKSSFHVDSNMEIAILVRNNYTLKNVSKGLSVAHRIYEDNPFAISNDIFSKLFTGLLHYRYNPTINSQDVISEHIASNFTEKKCKEIRRSIKTARVALDKDVLACFQSISICIYGVEAPTNIVKILNLILSDHSIRKQFEIKNKNEIQLMTLHKAKGLEFDVVFHLDLYEWVFPRREFTGNFDDPPSYPTWKQELDLHYVGVTRARKLCVLMTSTSRIKSDDTHKKGDPSKFMTLPGLSGIFIKK